MLSRGFSCDLFISLVGAGVRVRGQTCSIISIANQFLWLCCTLRSWVHEILSHYRTVSPRLGDNYVSKCSSDSFPHTKYVSPCVVKCQKYIAMHHWSHVLTLFFTPSPHDWRTTKHQSVVLRVFHA